MTDTSPATPQSTSDRLLALASLAFSNDDMTELLVFKAVNDTFGHDAGDDVLERIAAACVSGARAADIVGRWGGDEFLAILPETDGAQVVAQRIIEHHRDDRLSLSVGIAAATGEEERFMELVQWADAAMYRAKRVAGPSVA